MLHALFGILPTTVHTWCHEANTKKYPSDKRKIWNSISDLPEKIFLLSMIPGLENKF
jgi:hypothetical protein